MSRQQRLAKHVFFPLLVLGCLFVGLMIPTFYDWSGAGQRHSTPAAQQALWALVSFGVLSWFVIPWLPLNVSFLTEAQDDSGPFQFNIKMLLAITTIIAVMIAGLLNGPAVFGILLWVVAFVGASLMVSNQLSWKWQFSALLAIMYLPFAWLLFPETNRTLGWEVVFISIGIPAFLPTAVVASSFDQHPGQMFWLYFVLTAIEAAIGFRLIRTGQRRTAAYFVLVMLLSVYGSIFLNAVMRA